MAVSLPHMDCKLVGHTGVKGLLQLVLGLLERVANVLIQPFLTVQVVNFDPNVGLMNLWSISLLL